MRKNIIAGVLTVVVVLLIISLLALIIIKPLIGVMVVKGIAISFIAFFVFKIIKDSL